MKVENYKTEAINFIEQLSDLGLLELVVLDPEDSEIIKMARAELIMRRQNHHAFNTGEVIYEGKPFEDAFQIFNPEPLSSLPGAILAELNNLFDEIIIREVKCEECAGRQVCTICVCEDAVARRDVNYFPYWDQTFAY